MRNDRSGLGNQSESEANSQYMEMTKTKIEAIRQALMRFDKDLDDMISKDELLDFLDSNMKNGQKFDRGLANKIFEALDIDQNGKITCEEFIRNFISIEEEIKAHAKELQAKYYTEKENNANLNKHIMENKNEKLNDQGISQMSKVTIEIANIEFLTPIVGVQERISIRVKFEGEEKETRVLSGEDNLVVWKEKFEYQVNNRDILYFEVLNTDQFGQKEVIGAVKFPLDRIEKQEEYDLELEIPDENDDRIIMAKINAKIKFVWSVYKLYQDKLNKSERLLQNYNNMLQKTNKLLENLNEPMRFFQAVEEKYDSDNKSNNSEDRANKIKLKGKKHTDTLGNQLVDHTKQYEMADKLENLLKTTLSKIRYKLIK